MLACRWKRGGFAREVETTSGASHGDVQGVGCEAWTWDSDHFSSRTLMMTGPFLFLSDAVVVIILPLTTPALLACLVVCRGREDPHHGHYTWRNRDGRSRINPRLISQCVNTVINGVAQEAGHPRRPR